MDAGRSWDASDGCPADLGFVSYSTQVVRDQEMALDTAGAGALSGYGEDAKPEGQGTRGQGSGSWRAGARSAGRIATLRLPGRLGARLQAGYLLLRPP